MPTAHHPAFSVGYGIGKENTTMPAAPTPSLYVIYDPTGGNTKLSLGDSVKYIKMNVAGGMAGKDIYTLSRRVAGLLLEQFPEAM
jgi:hypothetical protein